MFSLDIPVDEFDIVITSRKISNNKERNNPINNNKPEGEGWRLVDWMRKPGCYSYSLLWVRKKDSKTAYRD